MDTNYIYTLAKGIAENKGEIEPPKNFPSRYKFKSPPIEIELDKVICTHGGLDTITIRYFEEEVYVHKVANNNLELSKAEIYKPGPWENLLKQI